MANASLGSPESWLDEHGAALYKYALVHTRDAYKAEEAVQETLLAALQGRDRFSGSASARTWLISILKHKIMDMFRHEAREVQLDDPDDLEEVGDSRRKTTSPTMDTGATGRPIGATRRNCWSAASSWPSCNAAWMRCRRVWRGCSCCER